MAESNNIIKSGQNLAGEVDEEATRESENGATGDQDELDVFGSSL